MVVTVLSGLEVTWPLLSPAIRASLLSVVLLLLPAACCGSGFPEASVDVPIASAELLCSSDPEVLIVLSGVKVPGVSLFQLVDAGDS